MDLLFIIWTFYLLCQRSIYYKDLLFIISMFYLLYVTSIYYMDLLFILLVCAWEDQRENQYYIRHKISSVLYGKYSTVGSKYSTVILIYHVVNNPP